MTFFQKILQIFKIKDLRKKLFFVLMVFAVFRIMANIPMMGINQENMVDFFQRFEFFKFASAFTGGALDKFSIVMLGIGPHITATIVIQLLTMVIPQLERIQKEEGEAGRQKLNQYGRLLTVPFALFQGYAMLALFQKEGVFDASVHGGILLPLITITTGSVFLMWLGEILTEKGIGNGVSLLIFAGIIADFPSNIAGMIVGIQMRPGAIQSYILLFAMIVVIIAGVVYFTEARRNVPISYAKRVRGTKLYGGSSTYLPLNLNPAGVIPIIFAFALTSFPVILSSLFANASGKMLFLRTFAEFLNRLMQNTWFFGGAIFVLVVLFTYFYTAMTFDPKNVSENLQKMGGFIPGIRPGESTAKLLNHILNRVLFLGAFFLGFVAILPWIVQGIIQLITGEAIEGFRFLIGGSSVLVIVSIVLETIKQINAQLQMRDYEGF